MTEFSQVQYPFDPDERINDNDLRGTLANVDGEGRDAHAYLTRIVDAGRATADQIAALQTDVAAIVSGTVPDGTITDAKVASDAAIAISKLQVGTAAAADLDDDTTLESPAADTVPSTNATKTYADAAGTSAQASAATYTDDAINDLPVLIDGTNVTLTDNGDGTVTADLTSVASAQLVRDRHGVWSRTPNFALRLALGESNTYPAKIAVLTDSEGELSLAFDPFAYEAMQRYPGTPRPRKPTYGGFSGGANLWHAWTHDGTVTTRGPSGAAIALAAGESASLTDWCDRIRVYFVSGGGTMDVTIDGDAAVTGLDTDATDDTITVTTTNGSTALSSSSAFTDDMRGMRVTGTGIAPDTVIDTVTNASAAVLSRAATASGSITLTVHRDCWTSAPLTWNSHTVEIAQASGTVTFWSYSYAGNFQRGAQIHVVSHSGWTTADFLASSGGAAASHVTVPNDDLQDFLALEDFDAVVFETVINDGSVAAYESNMGALLTATRTTLPNATFCLFTAEPGLSHAWMSDVPATARDLAAAHGTLHADMADIVYDHSGQSSGADTPYAVTGDGVHYSPKGAELASALLLSVLDVGPRYSRSWRYKANDGGLIAPYVRDEAQMLGVGAWNSDTDLGPTVWIGYIRTLLSNGVFAGDDGTENHLPTNYLIALGNKTWSLFDGRITSADLDAAFGKTDLIPRWYIDQITTLSVRVATFALANLTANTYDNGTSGVGATLTATGNGAISVDGVALSAGDRVLVKNQSTAAQNGIYVVTDAGSAGTPWVLTRATDFDEAADMPAGKTVFVAAGTTQTSTRWWLNSAVATVGTDAVTWTAVAVGASGAIQGAVLFTPALTFYSDATLGTSLGSIVAAAANLFNIPPTKFTQPTPGGNTAAGSPVQQLVTTTTGDDPTENVYQDRVTTTDATPTALIHLATSSNSAIQVEVTVVARRTGGSAGTTGDSAAYKLAGTFKNVSGTVTQIGTTTVLHSAESQAGWDAALAVSGTGVRVNVTGATNNNVTWHATARAYALAS